MSKVLSFVGRVTVVVLIGVGLISLLGCSLLLEGGGKFSVGMENTNAIVFSHSVDGDKQDHSSKSEVVLDSRLLDAILPPASDGE